MRGVVPQQRNIKTERIPTMIRSMTGFGREQAVINGREIIAEIRSVNHKFFEFSSKLPRNYQYLEPKLKTMLKEKITRGKVELSLLVYNIDVKDTSVKVNEQVAAHSTDRRAS